MAPLIGYQPSVLEALDRYVEAKTAHDQASSSTPERDRWSYYGQRYRDDLHRAERDFEEALDRHIDERITRRLTLSDDPSRHPGDTG